VDTDTVITQYVIAHSQHQGFQLLPQYFSDGPVCFVYG
jgi:hypothetical protein